MLPTPPVHVVWSACANWCFRPLSVVESVSEPGKGVLAPACCREEPCPEGGGAQPRQKSRMEPCSHTRGPVPNFTLVHSCGWSPPENPSAKHPWSLKPSSAWPWHPPRGPNHHHTPSAFTHIVPLCVTAVSYGLHTLGVPSIYMEYM